ncbi:MAG TPA: helix-turn-helix domain-containing protein, partial [Gammaproteobacteria bacterium]|nr:helix-turn-helix domain-containing protein [Gammaproteobacteria bacterium]
SLRRIGFTCKEVDILHYLRANSARPVSREELLNKVWGYGKNLGLETRTVDIHIAKLRRKIEPDPAQPRYLVTVRGAGYRLLTEA